MPLQVNEGGGAVLANLVSALGLTVHTGVSTTAIENHGNGLRVTLSDGETVDAVVLVFSAGVRPRDELARACGLDLADRGGVLTDIACRTSDPAIYAVGEVAAIEGRCYGLVAPGNATAEVVADRLLGGNAEFPGADLSRAELFQIVQATGMRTFSGLIAKHGTGTGCDICKPAVASILASTSSDHTSTANPRRCKTPTTTSWPTCSATAPTRSYRGCPAARSPRRS